MVQRSLQFWRWSGTINRGTYALLGFGGFAIKHNLDRLVAHSFGHRWNILNYWVPPTDLMVPSAWPLSDKRIFLALLLTALPFIWLGVIYTVKRLRDAGLPLWLSVLFFAPVVNLLFFALLCVLPSKRDIPAPQVSEDGRQGLRRFWPQSRLGSAALGVAIPSALGVLLTWLDLRFLGNYGLTLFIAAPFVMGYLTVWFLCQTHRRDFGDVLWAVTLCVLLAGVGILAIAVEGIICLLMAAPIAWLLAFFGGALAFLIHNRHESPELSPAVFSVLLVALPVLFGVEHAAPPPVPRFQVHTAIQIAAPPELVWNRLIAFPPLAPAKELPFTLGFAYPIEARIRGEGLTADRECQFSTGSFKEPILVWEPGKHFAFGVSAEPLMMKETSPYPDIKVRHLEDHDFLPERADFLLTRLENGNTLLEGTTTYQNKMWPGLYWRFWCDAIVHSIHNRVFQHVKRLAEADARGLSAGRS